MSALPINQPKAVQDLSGNLRLVPGSCVDERGCLMRSRLLGAHPELESITDAELLDFVWNNLDGGNAIVSCQGIILAVNKKFAEWMRMPAHELEGVHFDQITVPEDIGPDNKALAEVIMGIREEYTMNKSYRPRGEAPFRARLHVIPWITRDPKLGKVALLHSQVEKLDAKGLPVPALPDIVHVERWVKHNKKSLLTAFAVVSVLLMVAGAVGMRMLAAMFPIFQPAADAMNGGTP